MWMKCKAKGYRGVAVCLIVAVFLAVWVVPASFAVDDVGASAAIGQAEHDLDSAYVVVAEAEGAGADVSTLLNKLSNGGDFLSEAYAAFKTGDYVNASASAEKCISAVNGVADDAARLKTDAETARTNGFLFAVVGSSVGLVLLVVFGFLGWKLLKLRYFKQVMGMKPQLEGAD
jgi:hypothetical protein